MSIAHETVLFLLYKIQCVIGASSVEEIQASNFVQHSEEDCVCICETRSTGSRYRCF